MEILKLVLPCERKSSALEKKWNMKKFYFPKIERPGFGGGVDALRHFTKMMLFLEMLFITVRKRCFSKSHMPKKRQKVP